MAENGDEEWTQRMGGHGHDFIRSVRPAPDGLGYYMFGSSQSGGAGSFDMWLVRLDLSGQLEWQKYLWSFGLRSMVMQ